MKDRVPGAPGRYQAVITAAELQKMQSGEQFAITMKRDDQPLVEGTPYSKAAVLPDSVAGQLCPDINDPTPADALKSLADKSDNLQNNKADNVHQANGAVIAIHNSGNSPLHGLKVFGKTTQDGTPSPENPVELVSVGDGGSVEVTVTVNQLFDIDNPTRPGEVLNMSGVFEVNASYNSYKIAPRGNEITISFEPGASFSGFRYGLEAEGVITRYTTYASPIVISDGAVEAVWISIVPDMVYQTNIMINSGSVALPWEPYKGQSCPSFTPNGLPGIPVSSGGNYTDKNGQQYIANYRDWGRGVDVQGTVLLENFKIFRTETNSVLYSAASTSSLRGGTQRRAICTVLDKTYYQYNSDDKAHFYTDAEKAVVYMPIGFDNSNNVIKVMAALAEPIETPIPEEEMAAYRALHTNKPNTTIYNDAGAYMELEYYTPVSALPEGGGRMGGNIDMAGYRISGLGTPANPDDAINLGYANGAYAPAGYGYGEAAPNIGSFSTEADLETALSTVAAGMGALESKQFCFTLTIYGGYFYAAVIYKRTDSQFLVSAIAYHSGIQFYKRYDNGWQPLEWANPPMSPGIEYRTTERWAGAPVYTMLIEAGAIPNASRSSIAYPNGIVPNQVLRVCGQNHNGETIPRKWGDGEIWVSASRSYIYIETNTDLWSTYAALVQVWYTR